MWVEVASPIKSHKHYKAFIIFWHINRPMEQTRKSRNRAMYISNLLYHIIKMTSQMTGKKNLLINGAGTIG